MSDSLFLADSLTVRTARHPSGLVTTLQAGERDIPLTPQLMRAVLQLMGGAALDDAQRLLLVDAGLLRSRNPIQGQMPDQLALREDVSVQLQFAPLEVRLPGLQDRQWSPGERFFEGATIPPLQLVPLLSFHEKAMELWIHTAIHPDAEARLGQLLQRLWDDDFTTGTVLYDEGEPGRPAFMSLSGLHTDKVQYTPAALTLKRGDAEAVSFPVRSWEALRGLLVPLRLLARGVSGQELRDATPPAFVPAIKEWFSEDLLFEPPLDAFRPDPGVVLHLGHSTLLGNLGETIFLTDPWIPAALQGAGVLPFPRFAMPEVQALFLTTLDRDLADLNTLLSLDQNISVYVPDHPGAVLLRELGFGAVEVVAPGDTVQVGGITARAIPTESPHQVGWALRDEHRGLLVLGRASRPQLSPAEAGLSPVFSCRVRSDAPRLVLGWPVLLEPFEAWTRPALPVLDFAAVREVVNPDLFVLYAEGGGPWYDHRNPFIRRSNQQGGNLFERLMADPRALATEHRTAFRLSNPYDAYGIGAGYLKSIAGAFTRG